MQKTLPKHAVDLYRSEFQVHLHSKLQQYHHVDRWQNWITVRFLKRQVKPGGAHLIDGQRDALENLDFWSSRVGKLHVLQLQSLNLVDLHSIILLSFIRDCQNG